MRRDMNREFRPTGVHTEERLKDMARRSGR